MRDPSSATATVEQYAQSLSEAVLSGTYPDGGASLAGDPHAQDWTLMVVPLMEGRRAGHAPARIAEDVWTWIVTDEEDDPSALRPWSALGGTARENLVREVTDALVAFEALEERIVACAAMRRVSMRAPLAQTLLGPR